MNEKEWEFRLQEQFGRAYNPSDCIIFSVSMHFPETVVSINLLYSCCMFLFPLVAMTLDPFDYCKNTGILSMDWWSKNDSINQSVCYFIAFVTLIVLIYVQFLHKIVWKFADCCVESGICYDITTSLIVLLLKDVFISLVIRIYAFHILG
jgi:hypothetical protein